MTFINNYLLADGAQNGFTTEYAEVVLHFMMPELIDFELKFADKHSLYSAFLHDLREDCELRWDRRPPNNEQGIEL